MTDTALIVIDVQQSFTELPRWAAVSHPDIVSATINLVRHARDAGDLVVWILHAEPGSGTPFDPASGHVRLMPGLEPRPSEPVLTKTSRNAFTTTELGRVLTQRGITKLRICGIQTEQCCETTARIGADLGFTVDFVLDATATFPIPHWSVPTDRPYAELLADPRTLSADAIIERTAYALAGRFATITTIAEVTSAPAVAH
ncbi:isochorismatase family protein [Calidifontibacter sp. DB0510]|uniref:Isochorismatase family protein n=1 Tax=Metallococcus carri TaxID=1656884 RepID=A0A967B3N5_9MICO|nr:isochorismatase family protein [Metallococcus carri]NHN57384.1 isochorismatase family protein [Metallococcus carri]NOP39220.1 isochorismatase family protein [Calidifontibacter sp. DB2511S]